MEGFEVNREAGEGVYPLIEVFGPVHDAAPVIAIFGSAERARAVCAQTRVKIVNSARYMWINDREGSLMVSLQHLCTADDCTLYLDVVHELVHVRQLHEGQELFDRRYSYVDRPTEIEAYRITVDEARRLGLTDVEICNYLRVEWISDADFVRFLERLGVRPDR